MKKKRRKPPVRMTEEEKRLNKKGLDRLVAQIRAKRLGNTGKE